MGSKDKAGREARKPKRDKKAKAATATSVLGPSARRPAGAPSPTQPPASQEP